MENPQQSPHLTPLKRRGLILVPIIIIALVAVIFIGLNLSHLRDMKKGEAVGNASGVPGPENRGQPAR